MSTLILIPGRKGSKGLPGKNTKLLVGKPLVSYTIEFALSILSAGDTICLTTNDDDIIDIATNHYGIEVPFRRSEKLSSDSASMNEVILDALSFYESQNIKFNRLLLLQPTSPIREKEDYLKMEKLYLEGCEMVVSVKKSKENPYFTLFEEGTDGFLRKCKEGSIDTRQNAPSVYAYNGSMYLINVNAIKNKGLGNLRKIRKFQMPDNRSLDIDTIQDWVLAEFYLNENT